MPSKSFSMSSAASLKVMIFPGSDDVALFVVLRRRVVHVAHALHESAADALGRLELLEDGEVLRARLRELHRARGERANLRVDALLPRLVGRLLLLGLRRLHLLLGLAVPLIERGLHGLGRERSTVRHLGVQLFVPLLAPQFFGDRALVDARLRAKPRILVGELQLLAERHLLALPLPALGDARALLLHLALLGLLQLRAQRLHLARRGLRLRGRLRFGRGGLRRRLRSWRLRRRRRSVRLRVELRGSDGRRSADVVHVPPGWSKWDERHMRRCESVHLLHACGPCVQSRRAEGHEVRLRRPATA
jgi:hypothetical protein